MPYIWEAANQLEPIAADTIAAIANIANYNVVAGCAQTYSVSTMEKTVASGSVTHDGAVVTVAGNNVTLVSDPSNPRFTITGIDVSGTAEVISGDPAPTPAVPELGDDVMIGLDLIQAGQTIADNIVTKLDKRVFSPSPGRIVKAANQTVNNSNTLQNDSDFLFPVEANSVYLVHLQYLMSSGTTPDFKWAFTLPAGATAKASNQVGNAWSVINDATSAVNVDGLGDERLYEIFLHIETAATAGTAQWQWAQNTMNASDTTVGQYSVLQYQRVV